MISWYLNRLKTMSPAEIPYRIQQMAQKRLEKAFSVGKSPGEMPIPSTRQILPIPDLQDIPVLPNHIEVFGKTFDYTQEDIDWHKDIFTNERFPLTFAKSINMRSTQDISAKNVWEINRLLFLPALIINYKSTGDRQYLDRFVKIMTSWVDQNPYLLGINWYSNIEVNIRLINWFFCWQLLDVDRLVQEDKTFKAFVSQKWLPTIYLHCKYSHANPSKFSSANNHLISEYSGLFLAAAQWPFKESKHWLKYAQKGLEKEIQLQHANGVNKEEAAEYIQFITDFFLLPYVVSQQINKPFSKAYQDTLHQICQYIYHMIDATGRFPQYGDEDDGRCLLLDLDIHGNNFKSILTSGAILFNDGQLKGKSAGLDLKNQILFGEKGKEVFENIETEALISTSKAYPEAGHFYFKQMVDNREIFFHFDAAPLGFLSIAAHGHADALSFLLHLDGQPVFVDSGTFTYHTDHEWRQYFIGTLAHNTIRVNRSNQAVNGGPTMWIKHFDVTIEHYEIGEERDVVKAHHNGYAEEKVKHTRSISFDKTENTFYIEDKIDLQENTPVSLDIPFHLHPAIEIQPGGDHQYLLQKEGKTLATLEVDQKLTPSIIRGQESPEILGWYARSFLQKEPTSVIYSHLEIEQTTTFKFIIKIN